MHLTSPGLWKSSTNCYVALGLEGHEFNKHWRWRWREWWLSINVNDFNTLQYTPHWVNAGRFSQIPKSSFNSLPFPIPCHYCRSRFIYNLHYVSIRGVYNFILTCSLEFVTVCLAWISIKGTDINGMVSFHSLRFQVHVPSNATLMPVRLHQAPVCCDLVIWRTIGPFHGHGEKDSSAMCWWGSWQGFMLRQPREQSLQG